MNTNYSFPRRQQPRLQPLPDDSASATARPSAENDTRKSSALRASVLDAALQLGFGSDSKMAQWMFNEGHVDDDEDLNSPGLTSSTSTAPSSGTSEHTYVYPNASTAPSFSRDSPNSPLVFPAKASHIRRPSSDPFSSVFTSVISQEPGIVADTTSSKPRKLVKKRSEGHLSDGEYLSEPGVKKKAGKNLSRAERKELEKALARKEKEDKKQRKAEKESGTGYDTDGTGLGQSKKSKKKSKSRQASEGGYETDDGNQSSSGVKKSKSKFFRLGNRSKGDVDRADTPVEPEIPPVPMLPPIHPIADKFATSLSFDLPSDMRSVTPTPLSSLHSTQSSFVSSIDSSRTIQNFATESTATLPSFHKAPVTPPAEPVQLPRTVITQVEVKPSSPISATSHESAVESLVSTPRSPPKLSITSPSNYAPFINRSPQGSPLRSPNPSRLGLPSRPVGLPASPRPSDAAQIHSGSSRSPLPSSPRSFDTTSDQGRIPTPVSPMYSNPAHLHPGPGPSGRASPSQLSVLASSDYLVSSPLPSPRSISQYGVPPPTPPPTAPLPPPPPPEDRGRTSPFPQRSAYPNVSAGLEARVRSQKYNRNMYALPKRVVRSEDGHSHPPLTSYSLDRGRRHQSATTTTSAAPSPFSESDYDHQSTYSSPVEDMHDVLARYQHDEMHSESGHALARNQSIKYLSNSRTESDDDDESHYPEDEAGDEWRQSIMDNEKSRDAHNRLLDQLTTVYDDSTRSIVSSTDSSFTHPSHGVPAAVTKPGWI